MKRKIRLGVFGCRRGRTYIKTVYKGGLDSDMRITALCDANEDKLKEKGLPEDAYTALDMAIEAMEEEQ